MVLIQGTSIIKLYFFEFFKKGGERREKGNDHLYG